MKYDNKRKTMDLTDLTHKNERIKKDYQAQFSALKQTISGMQTKFTK